MTARGTEEHVERALRQESGFGRCKCGCWLIQYHHIIEYSVERHDRIEDMMALCLNHHAQATAHAMPEREQRRYKAQPYNIQHGYAHGQLTIDQALPVIQLGSCLFGLDGPVLVVDDEPLLSLRVDDTGALLLSVVLRDENDEIVGKIDKNEWVYGDPMPWDIRAQFKHLYVRNGLRNIALEVDAKTNPLSLRATLWKNGQRIEITNDTIVLSGRTIPMYFYGDVMPGMAVRINTETGSLGIGSYGRPLIQEPEPSGPVFELADDTNERFSAFLAASGAPTWPQQLEAAISTRHPDWAPLAALNLGVLARDVGDRQAARMLFITAAEYGHPEHSARAYFLLGALHRNAGELRAARTFYAKAANFHNMPWSVRAMNQLGIVLYQQGDVAAAMELWTKVSASPDDEQALDARRRLEAARLSGS